MEDEAALKQAFHAAFIAPSAAHRWESRQGHLRWIDGIWRDNIAGPLDSIVNRSGCEYVYRRNDQYFTGVDEPESLRRRLLEWHAKLTDWVEQFAPASDAEARDHSFMRSIVASMRELIERAAAIESRRWQMSRSHV